jgi:hypothetical protein|tara:strand:- start:274 stop:1068 length:795 start_codon:yes stop_codon:yes gene_type:complete
MGMLRGGFLILGMILLLVAVLAANSFLALSMSLDYDNVQEEMNVIVREIVVEQMDVKESIVSRLPFMQLSCETNSEFVYNDDQSGYVFVFPCDVISEGVDSMITYGVGFIVEEVYYEDYDCGFFDCFAKLESPFFLVSQHAKDYWNGKFYLSLVVALILIALMYFLIEQKANLAIIAGGVFVVASLPFLKVGWFASLFLGEWQVFEFLFIKASSVFWISFIFGIVLVGVGIGLRIWLASTGRDKRKFSKKEVRDIAKEEVKKSK